MTATFIGVDQTKTGTDQKSLDDRIGAENGTLGIVGNQWNGGGGRFNHSNPFTGNLAGVTNEDLVAILFAVDALPISGRDFTSNNLLDATEALTVPIATQDITFENCGNVIYDVEAGKSFSVVADKALFAPITPGTPGAVFLQGETFAAEVRCHELATESVLFQLPATQQIGLIYSDNLGRTANSDLSFTDLSATGESIVGTLTGNTTHTFRRIRSADGSINVTTDGEGAIDVALVGTGGRNRGQLSYAKATSNPWPTIADGQNHTGEAFLDDDYFTISVSDGTLPSDNYTLTDGVTPVLVKTSDKITLTVITSPTVTSSWLVTPGATQIDDSNMMSNNLVNSTGQNRSHGNGGHAFALADCSSITWGATTHQFLNASSEVSLSLANSRQISTPGYAAGAFDGVSDQDIALDSSQNIVTIAREASAVIPVGWTNHIVRVDVEWPAQTVFNLDGSSPNTTVLLDGSLTFAAPWTSNAAMAANPYFRCLVDGVLCDLNEVAGTWQTQVRDGVGTVKFTKALPAGSIIQWRVPKY